MITYAGHRVEALGGDEYADDLRDFPRCFVRFDSAADADLWSAEHRNVSVFGWETKPGVWYAVYSELDYDGGDCLGEVWYLRPASEGVGAITALKDALAAQLEQDLQAVLFENAVNELSRVGTE